MPINRNNIVVFDYETGGVDRNSTPILQIAAAVIDCRSLDIVPGLTFQSYAKPRDEEWELINADALRVNNITRDMLNAAPSINDVWPKFTDFINRQNKGAKNGFFTAPIAAGYNIRNFDIPITDRYAKKYGNWDKKEERNNLFSPMNMLDLKDILFLFFENNADIENYKFDTFRTYFGLSKEGSHNAIVDVQQTAEVLSRFLKWQRKLAANKDFKNAFAK